MHAGGEVPNSAFAASAAVYDALYGEKQTAEEVAYIESLFRRHDAPIPGRIVEFGCGTGRHARLLASNGHQVIGIERSTSMAKSASEAPGFLLLEGDVRTQSAGVGFDAVISLFHVMSYQSTLPDLLATFENAARHLRSGGLFIFDAWYTPAVMAQRPDKRTREVEVGHQTVTRTATPEENVPESIVDVTFNFIVLSPSAGETTSWDEVHRMRHMTLGEVQLLANQTGFSVLAAEEWLTGARPSRDTWGVCFVLRRDA